MAYYKRLSTSWGCLKSVFTAEYEQNKQIMSEVLIIDPAEWEQLMYLAFEYAEKNFISHISNNINKGHSAALVSTLLQKETSDPSGFGVQLVWNHQV